MEKLEGNRHKYMDERIRKREQIYVDVSGEMRTYMKVLGCLPM